MEKVHHITGNGKIDRALSLHTTQHAFNEVQDYLQSLKWDGVPRLDTLFIDYLGAEDSPYTRAVTARLSPPPSPCHGARQQV
ncbi:MAG: VapE domain-containing protein [Evtepia gabavorous]